MWNLLIIIVIAVAIYKIVEMSMARYERLQAMQKLEGQELVEYLGKAAPQEDYLKQTMWWLMRIASVLFGVGIGFLQVIWVRQFPEDGFGNTPEIMLVGGMMLCGALFLIIELFIERKLRK